MRKERDCRRDERRGLVPFYLPPWSKGRKKVRRTDDERDGGGEREGVRGRR